MSELPAPDPPLVVVATPDAPESAAGPEPPATRVPRAGDLTPGWRVTVIATWIMVFFAYAALWKASEEIGIGTWWLGSRSQPTTMVVRLLPFALAIGVALAAAYNVRRLPLISLAGSLLIGVSAFIEVVGRWSLGLALVEGGIALGALLVSLGSFTGRYRRAKATNPVPAAPREQRVPDADGPIAPPPTDTTDRAPSAPPPAEPGPGEDSPG